MSKVIGYVAKRDGIYFFHWSDTKPRDVWHRLIESFGIYSRFRTTNYFEWSKKNRQRLYAKGWRVVPVTERKGKRK